MYEIFLILQKSHFAFFCIPEKCSIFRSYCQDGAAPPPLTPKRRHFSFPARFSQVHDFEHENLLYIYFYCIKIGITKSGQSAFEFTNKKEDHTMAHVISDECVSCGSCESECPVGAISEGDGKYEIDADACVDCGACEAACPTGAISAE